MSWIGDIFSFVWDISQLFLDAYLEVKGWVWPFYYLQYPLYGLYQVFWDLLTPIAQFWIWAEDVWNKVQQIFSLEQITAYFRTWIDAASNAWDWVVNSFWNVWNIVEDWWSAAKYTVLAWIYEAKLWFQALLNEANAWIAQLQEYWDSIVGKIPTWDEVAAWWGNWPGNVMTVITDWWVGALLSVAGLIASAFIEREDFWAGWQDFREKVADFFTDPLEFLWTLFVDWFLGPEE